MGDAASALRERNHRADQLAYTLARIVRLGLLYWLEEVYGSNGCSGESTICKKRPQEQGAVSLRIADHSNRRHLVCSVRFLSETSMQI